MTRIKIHISNVKLPFYPPCEVKYRLQNGVSTPSSLIVGETQDLGPRFVKARSLEPIRDTSAEIVSRNHVVHQLVERLEDPAPVQVAELVAVESIHSSGAKSDPGEDEMVTRRMMSIGCFVPSTRPASQ